MKSDKPILGKNYRVVALGDKDQYYEDAYSIPPVDSPIGCVVRVEDLEKEELFGVWPDGKAYCEVVVIRGNAFYSLGEMLYFHACILHEVPLAMPALGRPTSDFDLWLREQARCSNCETYYGHSTCGSLKSDELLVPMREASGVPMQSFTVDSNASAKFCPLWAAEVSWTDTKRWEWGDSLEEEHSANAQFRAVDAAKGYTK